MVKQQSEMLFEFFAFNYLATSNGKSRLIMPVSKSQISLAGYYSVSDFNFYDGKKLKVLGLKLCFHSKQCCVELQKFASLNFAILHNQTFSHKCLPRFYWSTHFLFTQGLPGLFQ